MASIIAPTTYLPTAALAAYTAALFEAGVTPYALGALEAARGSLCNPNAYYAEIGDLVDYTLGYADALLAPIPAVAVAAHEVAAQQLADLDALIDEVYGKPGLGVQDSAGLFDEPFGIDYAAELEELRDGMDDDMWHSRGGW